MYEIGDVISFNQEGIEDHQLDEQEYFDNRFVIIDYLDSGDDFAYLVESEPGSVPFFSFAANEEQIY